MKAVHAKLMQIQSVLKAPKGQFNSFGKYHYRSLEDIFEGLKPHLKEHECTVSISDDITIALDRIYVKATVTFTDVKTGEQIMVTGIARESLQKKGMDESQITGTASSYARKYAMNGMFAIDDTKDADTDAFQNVQNGQNNQGNGNHQPQHNNGYNAPQMNRGGYNNQYNNQNQNQQPPNQRQTVPNQQQYGNQQNQHQQYVNKG